jgi:hypothetical protein
MEPIPQILERLYDEIEDAGPMPEMQEMGDKLDHLNPEDRFEGLYPSPGQ